MEWLSDFKRQSHDSQLIITVIKDKVNTEATKYYCTSVLP